MDKHTCSRDYKVRFLNSKWLGKNIQTNVKENPNLKLIDIMDKTKQKWNVGINKTLAYRAKSLAVDIVDGLFREQYTRIHDYGHELLRANPESNVKITSQPFQGGEESSESREVIESTFPKDLYMLQSLQK